MPYIDASGRKACVFYLFSFLESNGFIMPELLNKNELPIGTKNIYAPSLSSEHEFIPVDDNIQNQPSDQWKNLETIKSLITWCNGSNYISYNYADHDLLEKGQLFSQKGLGIYNFVNELCELNMHIYKANPKKHDKCAEIHDKMCNLIKKCYGIAVKNGHSEKEFSSYHMSFLSENNLDELEEIRKGLEDIVQYANQHEIIGKHSLNAFLGLYKSQRAELLTNAIYPRMTNEPLEKRPGYTKTEINQLSVGWKSNAFKPTEVAYNSSFKPIKIGETSIKEASNSELAFSDTGFGFNILTKETHTNTINRLDTTNIETWTDAVSLVLSILSGLNPVAYGKDKDYKGINLSLTGTATTGGYGRQAPSGNIDVLQFFDFIFGPHKPNATEQEPGFWNKLTNGINYVANTISYGMNLLSSQKAVKFGGIYIPPSYRKCGEDIKAGQATVYLLTRNADFDSEHTPYIKEASNIDLRNIHPEAAKKIADIFNIRGKEVATSFLANLLLNIDLKGLSPFGASLGVSKTEFDYYFTNHPISIAADGPVIAKGRDYSSHFPGNLLESIGNYLDAPEPGVSDEKYKEKLEKGGESIENDLDKIFTSNLINLQEAFGQLDAFCKASTDPESPIKKELNEKIGDKILLLEKNGLIQLPTNQAHRQEIIEAIKEDPGHLRRMVMEKIMIDSYGLYKKIKDHSSNGRNNFLNKTETAINAFISKAAEIAYKPRSHADLSAIDKLRQELLAVSNSPDDPLTTWRFNASGRIQFGDPNVFPDAENTITHTLNYGGASIGVGLTYEKNHCNITRRPPILTLALRGGRGVVGEGLNFLIKAAQGIYQMTQSEKSFCDELVDRVSDMLKSFGFLGFKRESILPVIAQGLSAAVRGFNIYETTFPVSGNPSKNKESFANISNSKVQGLNGNIINRGDVGAEPIVIEFNFLFRPPGKNENMCHLPFNAGLSSVTYGTTTGTKTLEFNPLSFAGLNLTLMPSSKETEDNPTSATRIYSFETTLNHAAQVTGITKYQANNNLPGNDQQSNQFFNRLKGRHGELLNYAENLKYLLEELPKGNKSPLVRQYNEYLNVADDNPNNADKRFENLIAQGVSTDLNEDTIKNYESGMNRINKGSQFSDLTTEEKAAIDRIMIAWQTMWKNLGQLIFPPYRNSLDIVRRTMGPLENTRKLLANPPSQTSTSNTQSIPTAQEFLHSHEAMRDDREMEKVENV